MKSCGENKQKIKETVGFFLIQINLEVILLAFMVMTLKRIPFEEHRTS